MRINMLGSGSYKSSLTYFRLISLARELGKLDWEVAVIVPPVDKYNDFKPERDAKVDHIELVQPWQPTTPWPVLNMLPYLLTCLAALLKRPADFIYIYKPTPLTILGLLPKLLFGTPVILDLDDLGSEVMRLQGQSKWQVKLVAACERLALRHANAVVVASTYLKSMIAEAYPDKAVTVISNGVDLTEFVPAKGGQPRAAIYYFGALNRLELIESFLRSLPEVVNSLPATKITIIGDGKALPAAKALVKQLGLTRAVNFTGWIETADIYRYVKYADVAVCTQPDIATVKAASNLKVFQYMALGSLPLVSRVGDLPSYVAANKSLPAGVAVAPDDTSQMAASLITLLKQDTAARRLMADTSRQRAETIYAWPKLASKLDTFLKGVRRHEPIIAAKEVRL